LMIMIDNLYVQHRFVMHEMNYTYSV